MTHPLMYFFFLYFESPLSTCIVIIWWLILRIVCLISFFSMCQVFVYMRHQCVEKNSSEIHETCDKWNSICLNILHVCCIAYIVESVTSIHLTSQKCGMRLKRKKRKIYCLGFRCFSIFTLANIHIYTHMYIWYIEWLVWKI